MADKTHSWEFVRTLLSYKVIQLTFLVVAGKGFIFIFHVLVARNLGLGKITDMFYFSLGIVTILVSLLGSTIESAIVPVYIIRKKIGTHINDINRLSSQLLCAIFTLSIVTIICIRFIGPVFQVFSGSDISYIQLMLACLLPYILFSVMTSVQRGIFNAEEKFLLGSVIAICEGLVSLLLLFVLVGRFGIYAVLLSLGFGTFCGFILGWFLLQKILIGRLSLRFELKELLNVELLVGHLTLPIIGTAIMSLNPLIDQYFLSKAGVGVITAFSQASRFFYIPVNLLISGLLPVLLTKFSYIAGARDIDQYRNVLRKVMLILLSFSVFVAIGLIYTSHMIFNTVFSRSNVYSVDIDMISNIFIFLQFGLAPYLATAVLIRANLAHQHHRLIFFMSIGNVILNIFLDMILYYYLGYIGIPIATSINFTIIFVLLYFISMRYPKSDFLELSTTS